MVVCECSTSTSQENRLVAVGGGVPSISTMPLRIPKRRTCSLVLERTTKAPVWPGSKACTGVLMWCMLLTVTGLNLPWLFGPIISTWLSNTTPRIRVPATTSPTPGTLKYWSMRNSGGSASSCAHLRLAGIKLKNCRSSGSPVPSTDEMVKMGVIADLPNPDAATTKSSRVRTAYGCLRAPGSFSSLSSCLMVSFITGSGHKSTLVITTKRGTLSAMAMPTCSLVIRVTPWLAPTTTIT
mmetsp:Transcript_7959/g.15966  ORF Transcript_7959/g.15966 Transcript_7959/m.15966 type:complete len:239 (-) Transcript_7959:715-1431(-)